MEKENESIAKTLSRNKIKKFSDFKLIVEENSENANFLKDFKFENEDLKRGWFDLVSLSLRYINPKLYNEFCPSIVEKKQIFDILSASRCISLGSDEFKGCKKNVKEILPDFKKKFFHKKK